MADEHTTACDARTEEYMALMREQDRLQDRIAEAERRMHDAHTGCDTRSGAEGVSS